MNTTKSTGTSASLGWSISLKELNYPAPRLLYFSSEKHSKPLIDLQKNNIAENKLTVSRISKVDSGNQKLLYSTNQRPSTELSFSKQPAHQNFILCVLEAHLHWGLSYLGFGLSLYDTI
jgi:hypothetical protein